MEPLELDLPTLVQLAGSNTSRMLLEGLAKAGYPGIRPSHGRVFQRLVEGEPTITALAASLGITQQGASKQVRELERLGYVERLPMAADQRARSVRLTPAGQAAISHSRKARTAVETDLAAQLGADTVHAAKVVLAALLQRAGLDDRARTRTASAPVR